jgi:hypothetical protein
MSMTAEPKRNSARLSRRSLLGTLAIAPGAASLCLFSNIALAQDHRTDQNGALCSTLVPKKSSKADVRHQSPSNSGKSCAGCRLFMPPEDCVVVEGTTTANSSCALWTDKANGRLGCIPEPKKPVPI